MEFVCTKFGDTMIVAPKGSINTESSPKLEKKLHELQAAGDKRLVVDFADVEYISSAGLRVLLMTARRLKVGHGALALCSMNPGVAKVFALCGFERDFTIVGGRDEAVSRVSAAATASTPPVAATPVAQPAGQPSATPSSVTPPPAAPAPVAPPPTAPVPVPAATPARGAPKAAAATKAAPPVVAAAQRALAAGLPERPRSAAIAPSSLVERVRRVVTP